MNNPESVGVENKGPLPPGLYDINLNSGVPTEKSGPAWGEFAVRLNPRNFTKIFNKLWYDRGGFFVHQDGNYSTNPGSAGCIAICGRADTYTLWNTLKSYQAAGNSTINVHIQYP